VEHRGEKKVKGLFGHAGFLVDSDATPGMLSLDICTSTCHDVKICTLESMLLRYPVIGELAKGDDAIYLYGYLELTDMGRRLPCQALLNCGATGVFTDAAFTEELGRTFY
jgi:hypothetical protein